MNLTVMSVKTREVDDAFAGVVEAFEALVSTQIAATLRGNRGAIAALSAAMACGLLGLILMAFGIRDALHALVPQQALGAVVGCGLGFLAAALGLVFAARRSARRKAG